MILQEKKIRKQKHNPNWLQIPQHPYRILINEGSGSVKPHESLNLISNQPDIHGINLYANYPYEAKYQFLFNKHKVVDSNIIAL